MEFSTEREFTLTSPVTTAAERVLRLPDIPAATDSYRSVGVTTRIVLDGGARTLLIAADGTARSVTEANPTIPVGNHEVADPDDSAWPVPDITVELSGEDLLALADGRLTVLRALTTSRIAARGPIFAAIGVAHALTHL
ncbi:hypothetical protein [Nocardiopsis lambiniae]|uniref:SCP2 domain-containing protein n=1 Tax=Nocardiopsis lambiniae TaxID=3075539 RepID=A0ABU2MB14_9ACTN|nr:hypothetical protein [Nocardiopsis sp. DSM 44743]MDT0329873.1 hypothetical protein [Nocardiopsis sp. DSM 44743]